MILKFKIVLILIFLMIGQNSQAQLRCSELFQKTNFLGQIVNIEVAEKKILRKLERREFAEVIDSLNSKTNNNIFKTSIDQIINPDLTDKNLWQQVKLRKQAYSLGQKLKELRNANEWTQYEFDNFSKKLSKISYLTDSTVLKTMTEKEKVIFLQARHSALSKGLEAYFFQESTTPLTVRKKIFQWMMLPFQAIWWRWAFAPVNMPKLNGSVMTAEDATALLWEGPQNRPDLVEKYSLTFKDKPISFYLNIFSSAQAKHYFNSTATLYNYGILITSLAALPMYGYLTFTELKAEGVAQATTLLTPTLKMAQEMDRMDFNKLAEEKDLNNTIELFRSKKQRDPTAEEIVRIKILIKKRIESQGR